MKIYTQLLTATVLLHKWRYRPIPRRCLLSATVLAFGLLAVSPQARASCREGCDLASALTFLGDDALLNDDAGFGNTAAGDHALYSNTDGDYNTATGMNALYYNTIGDDNTANGLGALFSNTTGSRN